MKYRAIVFAAVATFFFACGDNGDKNTTADGSVKTFDSLITHLDNELLIDVRTPEEFQEGHIEGAVNYNWNDNTAFTSNVADLDKSKPTLVYCRSGNRSSAAADYLRQNGFTSVYELEGGITAWKNAGMEVTKADETTTAPDAVSLAQYNKTIADNDVVLVDFAATWCGPCKMLAPSLHELETEMAGKFILLKVDVDRDREVADYMNIAAMPTLVLYKKGQIQWRNEGLVPKDLVAEKINSVQ